MKKYLLTYTKKQIKRKSKLASMMFNEFILLKSLTVGKTLIEVLFFSLLFDTNGKALLLILLNVEISI